MGSVAEEANRKTEQTDAVKDIMPTTDYDSGAGVENESDEFDESNMYLLLGWHSSACNVPKYGECKVH